LPGVHVVQRSTDVIGSKGLVLDPRRAEISADVSHIRDVGMTARCGDTAIVPVEASDLWDEPPQVTRKCAVAPADVKRSPTIRGNDINYHAVVVKIVVPWLMRKVVPPA